MICPYPDCDASTGTGKTAPLIELTEDILLCGECGRVAYRCVEKACSAANRPFTRFCVLCGHDQWDLDGPKNAADLWRQSAEFQRIWRFALAPSEQTGKPSDDSDNQDRPVQPRCVDVQRLDRRRFRPEDERPVWTMGDGVIFLHQGGHSVAAVHGYAEAVKTDVALVLEERALFDAPTNWRLLVNESSIDFRRPYPPIISTDRRNVVFSTPYGVAMLSPTDLEGWSANGSVTPKTILELAKQDTSGGQLIWLAAPPVLITQGETVNDEPLFGFLLARAEMRSAHAQKIQYFWYSTAASEHHEQIQDIPSNALELELQGSPCQIEVLGGRGLLFATDRGLWLWPIPLETPPERWQSIHRIRIWGENAVCRSANADERDRIVLDQHVRNRNFLRWNSLVVLGANQTNLRGQMRIWLSVRAADETEFLERVDLYWEEGAVHSPTCVRPEETRRVIPIGRGMDRAGETSYFLAADRGQLEAAPFSDQRLRSIRDGFANPISSLQSVQLRDPLMLLVRDEHIDSESGRSTGHKIDGGASMPEYYVQLRTLTFSDKFGPTIGPLMLATDPLFWLRSLFCLEIDVDKDDFVIRRYDLHVTEE
ncbi:MAG: zinc ribbon domain-containing protein [Planctomycetaceae bacterium]